MTPIRWTRPVPGGKAPCVALAAAILLAAGLPHGQAVLLRLAPEEGLASRYQMRMQTEMESPMMPSTGEPFMVMESVSTQTVTAVEGDVREYATVIDSMSIETPAMPGLAANMPDMTGHTQTMRMDVRGQIVGMELDAAMPQPAQQAMSRLGAGGFGMQLPEAAVSPGDTWTATQEFDMPGMAGQPMGITIDLTYTLESLDGDVAVVAYEGPLRAGEPGSAMVSSGQMSGRMSLDFGAGRLVQSDMEMSMEMTVQGQSLTLSQTMTMALVEG